MDTKEYKVILTPDAYKEINRIYEYILEDLFAEKAANRPMKLVEKEISYLKYEPKKYRKIDAIDDLQRYYRRIIIKNYILLYTIDEINKIVYVSHMFYGRKNYI